MRIVISLLLTIIAHTSSAQNVLISNANNPNEPSIMFDPNNISAMVAAANLDNVYTSNDGGNTWSEQTLTSPYGVWGDPALDVDTAGNFYFFHLSNPPGGNWIDRIVCQRSTDDGATWSEGTFTGLNGTKAQDKQWSVIDRSNNNIHLSWTQFDDYGSGDPNDKSIILYAHSFDGGATWSTPIKINEVDGDCIDSDNTVEGATPAIGPNGEVYVAWTGPNGLVFNRSLDNGITWLSEEISIDPMPEGWDLVIPGFGRANGLPITKCDLSGGPNHGTIYVNWGDQRNGPDDTDIWLTKSTDGGTTWSAPARVNDDTPGKHQFFSWMDIDQTNGHLYFVFYDRRTYDDTQTDVYMAISADGGTSFLNRKISESPFIPNDGVFFGDYTNIVAHNDTIRPIWTRLHNGQLSIWTNVTPLQEILTNVETIPTDQTEAIDSFPNPSSGIAYVSFKLHDQAVVRLEILDQEGKLLHSIKNDEQMGYGKYVIPINTGELGLAAGSYFYRLNINGKVETMKAIVVN
ncbi:MAG: T9SS type A sorting domain-containing protein [Flavobacteriales bacterium]|nr:T9SS type A sorting domain-containing protein [Flavobacteriales bacterium]MBK6945006.1 T9SS type A sorting domain-containing protein [Flavobacteriales bacterium]MBK7239353.1 T9SS type A sorting domain-containing protein [Flavobacteriales bacterium]MBK7295884.1 T9SS type A sorting domain-containing protein [Flavobacteriales bacterium]MBK9535442.1 T9SS type A sorting domain-containing protein [Flavobacteriales bacterium]